MRVGEAHVSPVRIPLWICASEGCSIKANHEARAGTAMADVQSQLNFALNCFFRLESCNFWF